MLDGKGVHMTRRSMIGALSAAGAGALIGNAPLPGAAPVAWTTRTVRSKTDGIPIVFHEAGKGPPLVIVHGGSSTSKPYIPLAEMLTSRFRVVRVERRNYSISGDRPSPITWGQEVGDIAAVIDRVGGKVFLFGHSAGALVSLHVARAQSQLIRRLALYEPPLLGGGPSVVPINDKLRALLAAGRKDDALVMLYGFFVGLPEAMVRERIAQEGAALYPLLPGAAADIEALVTLDTEPSHWGGIKLETLMLVGETSAAHPLRDSSAALAAVLPHVRTTGLPGQGHSAQVTAPRLIADAIGPFFGGA